MSKAARRAGFDITLEERLDRQTTAAYSWSES
jgi:hypothetical protein